MTLDDHIRAALGGLLWQTLIAAAATDELTAEIKRLTVALANAQQEKDTAHAGPDHSPQ